MRAHGAGGERAIADVFEHAALPEVERDGHDLHAVPLAQPRNRDRRVEAARRTRAQSAQFSRVGLHVSVYVSRRLISAAAPLAVAADDEDRVVAGNRADRFVELGAIERLGQRLRLAASGAEHDELLHAFDTAQERRRGALERRARQSRDSSPSRPGR